MLAAAGLKVMQLLAQVGCRQAGQARKAGCGDALGIRAMATQAGHGGRVLATLGKYFLAVGGVDGRQ
ncbi:hypothetical protein D9M71_630450 [compost metagenome]